MHSTHNFSFLKKEILLLYIVVRIKICWFSPEINFYFIFLPVSEQDRCRPLILTLFLVTSLLKSNDHSKLWQPISNIHKYKIQKITQIYYNLSNYIISIWYGTIPLLSIEGAWMFLDLAAMISRKVLCFSSRLQFYNRRFANNPICQELKFYQIIIVFLHFKWSLFIESIHEPMNHRNFILQSFTL